MNFSNTELSAFDRMIKIMSQYFSPCCYCNIIADINIIRCYRINKNSTVYESSTFDIYPPNFKILALS